MSIPFHGLLMPLKNSGMMRGNTTASCSRLLASPSPAMSFQPTPGLRDTMSARSSSVSALSSLCFRLNSEKEELSE